MAIEVYAIYLLRCWLKISMHVVLENFLRCGVYFLNIYYIRVFYRFSRSRALQRLLVEAFQK